MAVPGSNERSNPLSIFAALAGLAAFLFAALAIIVVSVKDDGGSSTSVASGGEASGAQMVHVPVALSEFSISMPDEIPVGAMFEITNSGSIEHDVQILGTDLKTPLIPAGQTEMLDLSSLPAGEYEVICTVPGHDSAGMRRTFTISEDATVDETVAVSHGSHGRAMSAALAAQLDEMMMDSMFSFALSIFFWPILGMPTKILVEGESYQQPIHGMGGTRRGFRSPSIRTCELERSRRGRRESETG